MSTATPTRIPRINLGGTGPAPAAHPVMKADHPPRFHADRCLVCNPAPAPYGQVDPAFSRLLDARAEGFIDDVAEAVTGETPQPAAAFLDPQLTPGQRRVLDAELPRLFRMLDRRDRHNVPHVVALLEDLADQAPAVDKVIAEETARRRAAAASRPTLALALTENRRTS